MRAMIKSDIWCDLSSQWISRNGVEGLDALQRTRFADHTSQCQACAVFSGATSASFDSRDVDATTDWPHLADETLRAVAAGALSQKEQMVVAASVEPHLEVCDYCADRLATVQEWDDAAEVGEAVVGRGVTAHVHWEGDHAELNWVMDQAATGFSVWRVSLARFSDVLEAKLSVEGNSIPGKWRFSLPLATDRELLPTIVFTPDSLTIRSACRAMAGSNWRVTPILVMPLPPWTALVSVGEDPATMISCNDAKGLEIAVRLPYQGPRDYPEIASWLNTLVVDLRGERLTCVASSPGREAELDGSVVDRKGRQMGTWAVTFLPDHALDLVIRPAHGEIVRLATDVEADALLSSPPSHEHYLSRLLHCIRKRSAQKPWDYTLSGVLQRIFEIAPGQMQFVEALDAVLGQPTRVHRLDLLDKLHELGVASDFESFELIIQTGGQPSAWAILVPRKPAEGAPEGLIELEIQLLDRRIILRPSETKSRPIRIGTLADPSSSIRSLKVAFREVPPKFDHGDDDE
jgi:hypothetical protein